jgi:predicted transglutaminase-like cysteine proteinase
MGSAKPTDIADQRRRIMRMFARLAGKLCCAAVICCSVAQPKASPLGAETRASIHSVDAATRSQDDEVGRFDGDKAARLVSVAYAPGGIGAAADRGPRSEPFGAGAVMELPSEITAKWQELQSRLDDDRRTIAACRNGKESCPSAAQRFLDIVDLARHREGRAQLGEINRAVNLSVRPVSDQEQYGVEDFWASPLATLGSSAGDCEDYAIVKYVALQELGIPAEDLRFVVVRDLRHRSNHAMVSVRSGEHWVLLDNETMIMANADEAVQYEPLFAFDGTRAKAFVTAFLPH